MKSRSVNSGARRIFVLVLDPGEDAFQAITDFADQEKIHRRVSHGHRRVRGSQAQDQTSRPKEYKPIIVNEQCEVLSLMGHVAQGDDGKASLHLHAALGLARRSSGDPAGEDSWPGSRLNRVRLNP